MDGTTNVAPHQAYCLISLQHVLQVEGFDDDAALDETIRKLEVDVKRARKKDPDGQDDVIVSIVH